MNKTQKVAWVNLVTELLCLTIFGYILFEIAILKKMPEGLLARSWPLIAVLVLIAWVFVWMRRRQSPKEVDADERDNLIKHRAVVACLVSVWVLLAAAAAIPRFVVGIKGSIPVWLLAFINLGVLLGAGLVYSVAVLVQYGWGGNDGQG